MNRRELIGSVFGLAALPQVSAPVVAPVKEIPEAQQVNVIVELDGKVLADVVVRHLHKAILRQGIL